MLGKFLKFNIEILISYFFAAVCTYYIGFGLSGLFEQDSIKLIFIVGVFIVSFVLSFAGILILLRNKQLAIKYGWLRFNCTALTFLIVLIAALHFFIWFYYKDLISFQKTDPYNLRKHARVENVKFYSIFGFEDSDNLYKFTAEPDELEKLTRDLNYVKTDYNSAMAMSWFDFYDKPPYWWHPKRDGDVIWYKPEDIEKSSWLGGVMQYDPKSKTVYMEEWDS